MVFLEQFEKLGQDKLVSTTGGDWVSFFSNRLATKGHILKWGAIKFLAYINTSDKVNYLSEVFLNNKINLISPSKLV